MLLSTVSANLRRSTGRWRYGTLLSHHRLLVRRCSGFCRALHRLLSDRRSTAGSIPNQPPVAPYQFISSNSSNVPDAIAETGKLRRPRQSNGSGAEARRLHLLPWKDRADAPLWCYGNTRQLKDGKDAVGLSCTGCHGGNPVPGKTATIRKRSNAPSEQRMWSRSFLMTGSATQIHRCESAANRLAAEPRELGVRALHQSW